MSWKQNLLRARSYIAVMLGFLIAFYVVLQVESHVEPIKYVPNHLTLSNDFPLLPPPRQLTFNEAIWARIAWQYFVNNLQPNGLMNAADNQPYSTMWDTGNYLMAMISAERLGIISRAELHHRLQTQLKTLALLPLTDGKLPAVYYHSQYLTPQHSLDHNPRQPDWSAIDISRLMMALNMAGWLYPEHATAIQQLTGQWQFDALFMQRESKKILSLQKPKSWRLISQANRPSYGDQLYALQSLRRTHRLAGTVLSTPQSNQRFINVDGMSIPYEGLTPIAGLNRPVVSNLPLLLTGLEIGFDLNSAEMSWRIMKVQENRYNSVGDLAYLGIDYTAQIPRFIDNSSQRKPPSAIDNARREVSASALQLSTRSVFSEYALFRTPWNTRQLQRVITLYEPGRGWYEGIAAETQQRSNMISATTNAAVLESLVYLCLGPLFCQNCMPTSFATPADDQQS
ncbi:MAG: DUF3131 domain-containing protein [Vibrio sp.]